MDNKTMFNLLTRYLILILLGFFNLAIFYIIFTPLTVYPVFWFVSVFDTSAKLLEGNVLFFSGFYAEIIPACIAGAAYYLLLILNLSTSMELHKRAKSLAFLLLTFLVLNIARILFFAALIVKDFQYFDLTHTMVWHFGSTLLIVLIWFTNIWLFNIRKIPVYTDIKEIVRDIKPLKKS